MADDEAKKVRDELRHHESICYQRSVAVMAILVTIIAGLAGVVIAYILKH